MCGKKIKVSLSLNSTAGEYMSCDLYEGHTGKCSKMFYHVKKNDKGDWLDNYRLGRIEWDDQITHPSKKTL